MPTWSDRAHGALHRARQERESLHHAAAAGRTKAKLVSQSQRVAEYLLKPILHARGIRVSATHQPHEVAVGWRRMLADSWPELAADHRLRSSGLREGLRVEVVLNGSLA